MTCLTHWGRVTHICVGKLTIIGSDNGLSPGRRQAIIWINPGILLIGPLGTNFSEILIGIQTFSYTKMHLKMSSAKWLPFCLGLNVLTTRIYRYWPPEDMLFRVCIISPEYSCNCHGIVCLPFHCMSTFLLYRHVSLWNTINYLSIYKLLGLTSLLTVLFVFGV